MQASMMHEEMRNKSTEFHIEYNEEFWMKLKRALQIKLSAETIII